MTDFVTARTGLDQARTAQDTASSAAATALARAQALTAALADLDRRLDPADRAGQAERARLQRELDAATEALTGARDTLTRAQRGSADALTAFGTFTDPRQNIARLGDGSPFVLLPVRIETRFVAAAGDPAAGQPGRLLVRIYPDDCSIDTFEELLSAAELSNTQRYWRNIWRAGGIESADRAAWRDLVTAHGSGRAAYLVETYQPVNVATPPVKAAATDEILVVATQTALGAAEASALAGYWTAYWQAGSDAAGRTAAKAGLDTAVGLARADQLIADYPPFNLADTPAAPATRISIAVSTEYVVFPADPVTKQSSWSQAPAVRSFPERFVVIGYQSGQATMQAIGEMVTLPLYTGPDPSADVTTDPTSGIHPDGDDLFVPGQLRWMVDFDAALAAGMALSIPLTAQQAAAGFDRLLVLGVQLADSAAGGGAALQALLEHHRSGRAGFAVVPQGTPAHNTTGTATGYTRFDDPDASFDDRQNMPLFTTTGDPLAKQDGQWLAEALDLDPAWLATVHASGGREQSRARAMQRAMWPATLGYWMDKLMAPVFSDETIEAVRSFVSGYVRGRGALPAVRIGGQPYGVLPTTAFSRMRWLDAQPPAGSPGGPAALPLARWQALLTAVGQDWAAMAAAAAHVGAGTDPDQTLLDVVGLHPSSAEYYSRYAESVSELYNVANLAAFGPAFAQQLRALDTEQDAKALLARLGYPGSALPDISNQLFLGHADQITTIIDDRPLSESLQVREYTDDHRNYLAWLRDAASTSLDALVSEQGFTGGTSPQALLYLFLRHALMLGFYDASFGLHRSHAILDAPALAALKPEPTFIHVADAEASESRFALLYKTEPRITGDPGQLVSDYISANLSTLAEAAGLADQVAALDLLVDVPTAELDRLFAEHIDICSYRYDAWLLGLVSLQLERMRAGRKNGYGSGGSVYLGAYAWVEELRPSAAARQPVQLPPDLVTTFGDQPLTADPANGGYIHAPSLPHARTAAVLRSGYLGNASSANPQTLSVNLSSDRVRAALSILEGIRGGQSAGALLGYQFERGLHDEHGLAEVDKFIYPLRKAFPLVADALAPTATGPGVPIEAIEARNVLDGRKLADHLRSTGSAAYPFGLTGLAAATAAEATAIGIEAAALLDSCDAIADLALAEGVHQAVQGNFERISATLDAYTTGNFPPEPEVAQTPTTGIGITHRVGLHLRPGLTGPAGATPAARAEPAVDDWLAGVLPPLNTVGATVTWQDPVLGGSRSLPVTLADLGVRPLDILDLVLPDDSAAMSQLDDRVLRHVMATAAPRPDADLRIGYRAGPAGGLSIFEVSALVRQAAMLITRSRPLRATDAMLHNDARSDQDATVSADRARVAAPMADLVTLRSDIQALLDVLDPLVADTGTHRADIISGADGFIDQAVELLARAASFRLAGTGWGFALAWRHDAIAALMSQVGALAARWQGRLDSYDGLIHDYDLLPPSTPDSDRFATLQAAELLITTTLITPPGTPALLRAALDAMRGSFATRRQQFVALLSTPTPSYAGILGELAALLPVTDVDREPFDITALGTRAVTLAEDLDRTLAGHNTAIDARLTATGGYLDDYDAAATPADAVDALQAAAAALLGEDFRIVPEFTLPAAQAAEWANAFGYSTAGHLLNYLVTAGGVELPVEEWAFGAARVRPMMKAWESLTVLVDALRGPADVPALLPVQFPYDATASWVALQIDPASTVDSDRLCYTAHYSQPFDKDAAQCGLLVDEWTEVIPGTSHGTGIAVNLDRPDNEPPQAILVVTPASNAGTWQWDDLIGALNETLELAKVRAVEPVQVEGSPYSVYVPATVTAATRYAISITTILAAANGPVALLGSADD